MSTTLLMVIGGLALLAVGAEALVRGSVALALRFGVTPLAVGLTVVAFGTCSPELFVSVEAAMDGNSGIALGNIVGSNISNIALILGIAALARPLRVRSELIRREVPLMIVVTLILCVLLFDGTISRMDGLALTIGSIAYTVFSYVAAKRERNRAVEREFKEALAEPSQSAWLNGIFVLLGLVALMIGARLLLTGAVAAAERLGISQVVIGLTVVAIGTSLPELATSVLASVRGEADVAFGNAIGSNILNILCILGVAALIHPIETQGLRWFDLAVLIVSTAALYPLMYSGCILNRVEGAILLAGYAAYLSSLIAA